MNSLISGGMFGAIDFKDNARDVSDKKNAVKFFFIDKIIGDFLGEKLDDFDVSFKAGVFDGAIMMHCFVKLMLEVGVVGKTNGKFIGYTLRDLSYKSHLSTINSLVRSLIRFLYSSLADS